MSASLVGSEMCIRDRFGAQAEGVKGGLPLVQEPQGLHCRVDGHIQPSVPVSYTHLTLPTICSV
eukprot:55365-Alexandrium_andersonii.AAC.1